jgi:hypothetical protein
MKLYARKIMVLLLALTMVVATLGGCSSTGTEKRPSGGGGNGASASTPTPTPTPTPAPQNPPDSGGAASSGLIPADSQDDPSNDTNNDPDPSSAGGSLVGTWDHWDVDDDLWEWNFNEQGEYFVVLIVFDEERQHDYWQIWDGTYTVSGNTLTMTDILYVEGGSVGDGYSFYDPPEQDRRQFRFSEGKLYLDDINGEEMMCEPSFMGRYWSFEHKNNYQ